MIYRTCKLVVCVTIPAFRVKVYRRKAFGGNREGTVKTGLNRNIPCKMVETTLALSFIAQDVRNAKKEQLHDHLGLKPF